jgi:hypothetical protein
VAGEEAQERKYKIVEGARRILHIGVLRGTILDNSRRRSELFREEGQTMREFESHWEEDGSIKINAPGWARFRADMIKAFPSPFRGQDDPLAREVYRAVTMLDQLKPGPGGPVFLGKRQDLTYTVEEAKSVKMGAGMRDASAVIGDAIGMFEGLPNWGHPLSMCNVIPQANTASIVAAMCSSMAMRPARQSMAACSRSRRTIMPAAHRPCRMDRSSNSSPR